MTLRVDAQRFFITALHAAHSAGDRELGANVLGFMSCQAKDLGKHDDATKLADTAITGYKGASPRVSAILHMRAAQAYANTGDTTETRRSIEFAYSAFRDVGPDQVEPAWSYWLDEAQINEQIGYCYLKLKDRPRATSHMRTAVRLQGSTLTREGALRLTLLADTYAQQGEPERACELGTRAIDTLATQVDSTRCVGHVQTLREHLTPFRRVPAVQDFTQRASNSARSEQPDALAARPLVPSTGSATRFSRVVPRVLGQPRRRRPAPRAVDRSRSRQAALGGG
jgi:tetratricopeptide (TPR) repeat protein